jgi:hypothetical protein
VLGHDTGGAESGVVGDGKNATNEQGSTATGVGAPALPTLGPGIGGAAEVREPL